MQVLAPADRLARLRAWFSTSHYERALPEALALIDAALAGGDRAGVFELSLVVAKIHANEDRHAEAVHWASQAAALAAELDNPAAELQAWVLLAGERARREQPEATMEAIGRVLPLLPQVADPSLQAAAHTALAFAYQALGMPGRALEAARRALEADPADDEAVRLRYTMNLVDIGLEAWDLGHRQDPEAATRLLAGLASHCRWMDAVTAEYQRRGLRGRAGWCRLQAGVQWRTGDWPAARATLESFLRPDWNGPAGVRRNVWLELARVCDRLGDGASRDAALAQVRRAQDVVDAERPVPPLHELPNRALLAELSGEPAKALDLLRDHQRRLQRQVLGAMEARIESLTTQLETLQLRVENDELRSRNAGLVADATRASRLAATDALTGLPNRRAAAAAFETLAAEGRPFMVALLDLDHFKRINDQHAHATGDAVLREVAAIGQQWLGAPNLFARYGGEEFLILLDPASLPDAGCTFERLRAAIEQHDWACCAEGVAVTASIGVCRARPCEPFERAIDRADRRLYDAKAAGRNRVVHEDP